MEVNIQEIDSAVHLTDGAGAQDPQLIEAIARVAVERMKEHQAHERRIEEERQLWPGVSARQTSGWA